MKNQDERGRTLYTLELLAVLVLLAVMLVDSLKQGNVGMAIFLAAGVLAVLLLIYVEFILPRLPEKKSKANKRPSAARKQSKPEKAQPQPKFQTAADKAKEAQEGTTASTRKDSRPEIKDIGQAAAYSAIETNMRPGGLSEFSKDCKYQITLFRTNRGPTGWGIDEEVVVDSRDHTPYWIVTQYDGQIAASIWYLEKKKLTFDEVRAYARDVSEEVYNQVCGINAENYKQIAETLEAAEAARRAEKTRQAEEARKAEKSRKVEEAAAKPEMAKPVQTAKVDILRERIIAKLEDFPMTDYLLDSLYGEEVPPDLYTPDFPFAHFNLNVRTRELSVVMDNYPDKDGRPGPSCYRPLTPEEFHILAVQSKLAPELVDFRTQADWDALYDDALLEAIKVNDRLTARQKEEIRRSGVMIPDECFQSQPKMNIASITFGIETFWPRISILQVRLTQENGKYRISRLNEPNFEPRVLSDAEAVYAENELERLRNLPIHDPDDSEVSRLRQEKNEAHFVKLIGSMTDGTEIRQTVESECTMLRLCYGSWRESEKLPDAAAVNALREKILQYCDNMVKQYSGDEHTVSYEKAKQYLLYEREWDDPHSRWGPLVSDFYRLDLEAHALSVKYHDFPYKPFSVMPEKFHETAKANGFPAELLAFKTQSDWDWLFDAKLIKAVARMKKAAEKAGLLT